MPFTDTGKAGGKSTGTWRAKEHSRCQKPQQGMFEATAVLGSVSFDKNRCLFSGGSIWVSSPQRLRVLPRRRGEKGRPGQRPGV